jgi:hypothetical protein
MINRYAGAFKTWIWWPIFKVRYPSVYSLRVAALLTAVASIVIFWPGGARMAALRGRGSRWRGPQSKTLVIRYIESVASSTVVMVAARRPLARTMRITRPNRPTRVQKRECDALGRRQAPPVLGDRRRGCATFADVDNTNQRLTRFAGRFLGAVVLGCVIVVPAGSAAGPTDKLTSLALHPGLTFQQEVDSPVCGKSAQMDLYDTPNSAILSEYVAWYREQLKGFHYVHKIWAGRSQEMFYSPNGSKGLAITANPSGPGVYAVTYMKMSSNLTTHEMDAFSPSNPSCK